MWYVITLAIGLILVAISFILLKNTFSFLKRSERTVATVIELERVSDSDGDTFKPVFKYKTLQNQEMIYKSISSSNPPGWKIGEETIIMYDPENPSKARVLTYFGTFSGSIILLAIAMPLLVIGGGYFLAQPFLK